MTKRNPRRCSRGRAALGTKASEADVQEQGRVLRSGTVVPRPQGNNRPRSFNGMGYIDATEADSEPVDEIIALGLPEDRMEEDTDEEEAEEQLDEPGQVQEDEAKEQEDEEMEEVEKLEDENDIDWAAPKRQSSKKQTPPREKRRSPAKEIIEIENDESHDETVVDPDGDSFMPYDSPEPVQQNGQSRSDHRVSTPNSVSAASSRPRRSIQQPSRLVSDTPRSSLRQSTGSAEYTSATLAVRSPPGSPNQTPSSQVPLPKPATSQGNMRPPQQPTPTTSATNTIQNLVEPRPQSHTAVPGNKSATQLKPSSSQPSAPTSASNSQSSSATPRTQVSSQPLASPRTGATSLTPQQQSGNWPSAPNPVAPPGAYNQFTNSQQSTPHHLLDTSRGNTRLAESSPTASGAKRQMSYITRLYHQSQVSRAINWDAVLPSGDEFKESLKSASDAIKPILHKFEDLLTEINDEQRKLSAVQNSLFQKKNDYTNDQQKAQDALNDVDNSTANESTTLRSLEEGYQQNPSNTELRTLISKWKQTILEHKEVYAIVKNQLDKSIAGINKTDQEIALVTERLGQLDAERADVLKEKEGVDKAAKWVTIMAKFMEPSWQATLDMLLQSVGPEVLEKAF